MKARHAVLLALTISIALAATCVFAATKAVSKLSLAHISVQDRETNLNLMVPIPASLVRAALTIPDDHCNGEDLRTIRTALAAVNSELAKVDNVTLVQVEERDEKVLIRKEGEYIRIHVQSPDSNVNVAVPQSALEL